MSNHAYHENAERLLQYTAEHPVYNLTDVRKALGLTFDQLMRAANVMTIYKRQDLVSQLYLRRKL